MDKKFLCIHGHFYQPPRENAWLEEIEIQPSAHPYHDWNERINEECYASNTHSRILNEEGKITDIVSNYAKISFNFGPTLLSWMEQNALDTHQAIIDADKESMTNFNGHGSAVAQVFNHIIMPLANRRDKETQIIWGLFDFKKRFGRNAEGIWLAESAVDTETLEICVDHGIKFTILAPSQAKRFRKIGDTQWSEGINSNFHYVYKLPSGKSICLFFYDGDRSQGVAFKGLLDNGKAFADDLLSGFQSTDQSQLVHIATDGESYGHHHKNGDMALAYCIRYIENNNLARITNYSEYLSLVEPQYEAEIHENSSWSCAHGIERWRSDCGCHTGGEEGWNQAWRAPLRVALNNLRENLIKVFEKEMKPLMSKPWEARNAYIEIVLNRTKANIEQFLAKHSFAELNVNQKTKAIRLLEMQRHAQLMFTSCGWFFNELSGIETVQILQYAARAIQLAESESKVKLEEDFLNDLGQANSNFPEIGSGKDIYLRHISPYKLTLTQVGMHYAVASLFANNPTILTVLNYDCNSVKFERIQAGIQRLAIGTTHVSSKVTLSQKEFSFVVLYLGQHHLIGGTAKALSDEEFEEITNQLKSAFNRSNIAKVNDLIKEHFKEHNFSFFQMFKDEQLKLVNQFLNQSEDQAYESYRKIYDVNYNIMNVMLHENLSIPDILRKNLEMVINMELKDTVMAENFDLEKFRHLVKEVQKWNVKIDEPILNKQLQLLLEKLLRRFEEEPVKTELLKNVLAVIQLIQTINLLPNLIIVENSIFNLTKRIYTETLTLDNQKTITLMLESIADLVNIDVKGIKESLSLLK
jgi:alpha-amylase/alpha-mannosidase (GH57 family)